MISENQSVFVEIDGKRFEIALQQIHNADPEYNGENYSLAANNKKHEIKLIDFNFISGECTVLFDGQIKEIKILRDIDVRIEKMGLNVSHSNKQSQILSPMPGLVTGIKVSAGQHVIKGEQLILLEAMKMENVISAPHDAVIKNIRVNVGQPVERGLLLIELESDVMQEL